MLMLPSDLTSFPQSEIRNRLRPADQGITLEAPIRKVGIVEREVQTAAFLSAEGRIDYQRGDRGKVAELQQVDRNLEIPIKLADFALQIAQPRAGSLEPFARPDDPDVIPHQAADLVPIVINHDELIHILDIPRFPFRK